MFDLEMKKPKELVFGDNEALFYVKLQEIKPILFKNKTYLRKIEEFNDLCKILNLDLKSKRIKKYLDKELEKCIKYIEKIELNICKINGEKFVILFESYYNINKNAKN